METSMLFMIGAIFCGFVAVALSVLQVDRSYRRKLAVLSANNLDMSMRSFLLFGAERGIPCLTPLANLLLHQSAVEDFLLRAIKILRAHGKAIRFSIQAILTLYIAVLIFILLFVFLLTRSLVAACAVTACIVAASVVAIGSADERIQNKFREDIPAVLELMNTCFGSGFTLLQTFQQIAKEMNGEIGNLFSQGAHVMETGGSVVEALDILRFHMDSAELIFIVAALEVQHQNGGALTGVLATAAESVKNELELKQTLRTQTAQAKLSARVVIVMPFVLIALFSLISPDFLSPFFSSIAGYVLFGIAISMELAGIVLVKRSLRIGGLSC